MRPRLSPERISAGALALIEKDGLEAFSTRRLGEALGVEAMALYHHFPSRAALFDAVAERLVASIALPADSPDILAWLAETVRRYVMLARRYPQAFPLLATRRFNTEPALLFVERILAALEAAGASPQEAADIFRGLGAFANGAALADLAIRSAPALADRGVDTGRLPHVARAARFLGAAQAKRQFEANLAMLMMGVAERLKLRPASSGGRRIGAKKKRRSTRKD
ncbi:MAG: TetR family transcriptional regulator [Alphaproteobacteria bacterium]|nr:TetR family transcriptional regulator [Alphaproteobacteria bacterium]